jgi:hypothetical protein
MRRLVRVIVVVAAVIGIATAGGCTTIAPPMVDVFGDGPGPRDPGSLVVGVNGGVGPVLGGAPLGMAGGSGDVSLQVSEALSLSLTSQAGVLVAPGANSGLDTFATLLKFGVGLRGQYAFNDHFAVRLGVDSPIVLDKFGGVEGDVLFGGAVADNVEVFGVVGGSWARPFFYEAAGPYTQVVDTLWTHGGAGVLWRLDEHVELKAGLAGYGALTLDGVRPTGGVLLAAAGLVGARWIF